MRIIVTGLNGTVAPVVAGELARASHQVAGWDRAKVPVDDRSAIRSFFDAQRPESFFHIATGPPEWIEAIATECAARSVRLLFTSSVSVFSDRRRGPFPPSAAPDAADDYGKYKADCEARVQATCPDAVIVRLGWQIGTAPGSNNMIDYLYREATANGKLTLSRNWLPACSFLEDTAKCLVTHFEEMNPGIYHLDGNPGLSIFEIARQLKRLYGWDWEIEPLDEPDADNRMEDPRLNVRPISERLAN
jgi:dTDP-4-dehydrorhamnose reductase